MPKENASLPDDLRPIPTHDDVAQHRRSGMLGVPRCGKKDESSYLARLPELRYDVSRGPQCELRPITPRSASGRVHTTAATRYWAWRS